MFLVFVPGPLAIVGNSRPLSAAFWLTELHIEWAAEPVDEKNHCDWLFSDPVHEKRNQKKHDFPHCDFFLFITFTSLPFACFLSDVFFLLISRSDYISESAMKMK